MSIHLAFKEKCSPNKLNVVKIILNFVNNLTISVLYIVLSKIKI